MKIESLRPISDSQEYCTHLRKNLLNFVRICFIFTLAQFHPKLRIPFSLVSYCYHQVYLQSLLFEYNIPHPMKGNSGHYCYQGTNVNTLRQVLNEFGAIKNLEPVIVNNDQVNAFNRTVLDILKHFASC